MTYTNGQTTVDNTSKKISKSVNSLKGQSAEMVSDMKERGEGIAEEVTAFVKEEGQALYSRFEDTLSSMGTDLKDLRAKAEKTVVKHPYYTVLGAAAFGLVAGLILRGRSRRS